MRGTFWHQVRGSRAGSGLLLGIVLVGCGVLLTGLLAVAIWPGELKLAAPLLCPDGKTDAYVVIDSNQFPPNRTSYDLSLYCMGPRGNFEDVGFGAPFLILSAFHTGLLGVAAAFFLLPAALRRRRASGRQHADGTKPIDRGPGDIELPEIRLRGQL